MSDSVNEFRMANMFYEQRGPMVFSASVHLVALVVFGIWSLISPKEKPAEQIFELVLPPPGGYAEDRSVPEVKYERGEQAELPTEEDIVLPDRPAPKIIVGKPPVVEEQPMVPVEPIEQPLVKKEPPPVVEKTPPAEEEQPMSHEEFLKQFNQDTSIKNVGTTKQKPKKTFDLSADLKRLQQDLDKLGLKDLPRSDVSSMSVSDQQAVASYLARLNALLRRSVDRHPMGATPLVVTVTIDISGGGHITNIRVTKRSGDAQFDQKVVDAFKRIRIFDAPPDGVGFTVPFRFVQE